MQQQPQKYDAPLANNEHPASRPGIVTFVALGAISIGVVVLFYLEELKALFN